jgi:hypothetical protein
MISGKTAEPEPSGALVIDNASGVAVHVFAPIPRLIDLASPDVVAAVTRAREEVATASLVVFA